MNEDPTEKALRDYRALGGDSELIPPGRYVFPATDRGPAVELELWSWVPRRSLADALRAVAAPRSVR